MTKPTDRAMIPKNVCLWETSVIERKRTLLASTKRMALRRIENGKVQAMKRAMARPNDQGQAFATGRERPQRGHS
jgi:hypothetical protein